VQVSASRVNSLTEQLLSESKRAEKAEAERNQLENEGCRLRTENSKQQEQLARKAKELQELDKKVDVLEAKLASGTEQFKHEVQDLQATVATVNHQLMTEAKRAAKAEAEHSHLKEEAARLRAENSKLEEQLASKARELREEQHNASAVEAKLAVALARESSPTAETGIAAQLEGLTQQLLSESKRVVKAEAEASHLSSEVDRLRKDLSIKQDEASANASQLHEQDIKVDAAEAKLAAMTAALEQFKRDVQDLKATVETVNHQLLLETKRAEKAQAEHRHLKEEAARLKSENVKLEEQLASKARELQEQQKQLEAREKLLRQEFAEHLQSERSRLIADKESEIAAAAGRSQRRDAELQARITQLEQDSQKRESELLAKIAQLEHEIDQLRRQFQVQTASSKPRVGDWL